MRAAALAAALLLAGCGQVHVQWDRARLYPAAMSEGSDALVDPNETLLDKARHTAFGLRLTVPIDIGWDSAVLRGPHWMPDPGYPTGTYAADDSAVLGGDQGRPRVRHLREAAPGRHRRREARDRPQALREAADDPP